MKTGFKRSFGILVHPTSFAGREGIGTLGTPTRDFLDFACLSGASWWQVCPLGPTGYGDSPYQCFSARAGNPLLIDLGSLADLGLLAKEDLQPFHALSPEKVDFGPLIPMKNDALSIAWKNFRSRLDSTRNADRILAARFLRFRQDEAGWIEDFALFMALKEHFGGGPWTAWPPLPRDRDPQAINKYRRDLADQISRHVFVQWIFFDQWNRTRNQAREHGMKIIGDMPIFVAHDSADVWTRRELFQLLPNGMPRVVAGVPPDYFSATGQLWGNPLYDWDAMEADGFGWWIQIMAQKAAMYDLVRVDHFRGFAACWTVPGGDLTAEHGTWEPVRGHRLFTALQSALGKLPILAEDLGVITPDVEKLKDDFGFPGMKILQFAFDQAEENDHLPHNYHPDSVVYTGTHDNDTANGWFARANESDQALAREYLGLDPKNKTPAWDFIRAAFASVPFLAVIPLQDILDLGPEARMNRPGSTGGNWSWRHSPRALVPGVAEKLKKLARLYGRC